MIVPSSFVFFFELHTFCVLLLALDFAFDVTEKMLKPVIAISSPLTDNAIKYTFISQSSSINYSSSVENN